MIDPRDIDPNTGKPYPNYSSPSLDTSFYDNEADIEETDMLNETKEYVSQARIWLGIASKQTNIDYLYEALMEAKVILDNAVDNINSKLEGQ